jgi:hypothetical protein
MKYVLLIQQGDTPTPDSPEEWARLSEEEQSAVYSDYQAVNQTPGVTLGPLAAAARDGNDRSRAGRQDADDGRAVRRGQGSARRLARLRRRRPGCGIGPASHIPAARMGGSVEIRPVKEG